jgi:hypothetical protein
MKNLQKLLEGFHHFSASSLPHLFALLFHSPSSFLEDSIGLIMLDSVSTLFSQAFPRTKEFNKPKTNAGNKIDPAHWAAQRRWVVQGDFMSHLGKLAATKNMAILVTLQTSMKARTGGRAILTPAISSATWDKGVLNRVVLFRDWWTLRNQEADQACMKSTRVRFAGVLKARGISRHQNSEIDKTIPFIINSVSVLQLQEAYI